MPHASNTVDLQLTIRYHGLKASQYFSKFTPESDSVFRSDLTVLKLPHPKRENTTFISHGCIQCVWPGASINGVLHKQITTKSQPPPGTSQEDFQRSLHELSISNITLKKTYPKSGKASSYHHSIPQEAPKFRATEDEHNDYVRPPKRVKFNDDLQPSASQAHGHSTSEDRRSHYSSRKGGAASGANATRAEPARLQALRYHPSSASLSPVNAPAHLPFTRQEQEREQANNAFHEFYRGIKRTSDGAQVPAAVPKMPAHLPSRPSASFAAGAPIKPSRPGSKSPSDVSVSATRGPAAALPLPLPARPAQTSTPSHPAPNSNPRASSSHAIEEAQATPRRTSRFSASSPEKLQQAQPHASLPTPPFDLPFDLPIRSEARAAPAPEAAYTTIASRLRGGPPPSTSTSEFARADLGPAPISTSTSTSTPTPTSVALPAQPSPSPTPAKTRVIQPATPLSVAIPATAAADARPRPVVKTGEPISPTSRRAAPRASPPPLSAFYTDGTAETYPTPSSANAPRQDSEAQLAAAQRPDAPRSPVSYFKERVPSGSLEHITTSTTTTTTTTSNRGSIDSIDIDRDHRPPEDHRPKAKPQEMPSSKHPGKEPRAVAVQRLTREACDIRREIAANIAREASVIDELRGLKARWIPAPTRLLEEPKSGGAADDATTHELAAVQRRLAQVEEELAAERRLRREAQDAIADIRRECRAPFVVPSLLDAFVELSRMTTVATTAAAAAAAKPASAPAAEVSEAPMADGSCTSVGADCSGAAVESAAVSEAPHGASSPVPAPAPAPGDVVMVKAEWSPGWVI